MEGYQICSRCYSTVIEALQHARLRQEARQWTERMHRLDLHFKRAVLGMDGVSRIAGMVLGNIGAATMRAGTSMVQGAIAAATSPRMAAIKPVDEPASETKESPNPSKVICDRTSLPSPLPPPTTSPTEEQSRVGGDESLSSNTQPERQLVRGPHGVFYDDPEVCIQCTYGLKDWPHRYHLGGRCRGNLVKFDARNPPDKPCRACNDPTFTGKHHYLIRGA